MMYGMGALAGDTSETCAFHMRQILTIQKHTKLQQGLQKTRAVVRTEHATNLHHIAKQDWSRQGPVLVLEWL